MDVWHGSSSERQTADAVLSHYDLSALTSSSGNEKSKKRAENPWSYSTTETYRMAEVI